MLIGDFAATIEKYLRTKLFIANDDTSSVGFAIGTELKKYGFTKILSQEILDSFVRFLENDGIKNQIKDIYTEVNGYKYDFDEFLKRHIYLAMVELQRKKNGSHFSTSANILTALTSPSEQKPEERNQIAHEISAEQVQNEIVQVITDQVQPKKTPSDEIDLKKIEEQLSVLDEVHTEIVARSPASKRAEMERFASISLDTPPTQTSNSSHQQPIKQLNSVIKPTLSKKEEYLTQMISMPSTQWKDWCKNKKAEELISLVTNNKLSNYEKFLDFDVERSDNLDKNIALAFLSYEIYEKHRTELKTRTTSWSGFAASLVGGTYTLQQKTEGTTAAQKVIIGQSMDLSTHKGVLTDGGLAKITGKAEKLLGNDLLQKAMNYKKSPSPT